MTLHTEEGSLSPLSHAPQIEGTAGHEDTLIAILMAHETPNAEYSIRRAAAGRIRDLENRLEKFKAEQCHSPDGFKLGKCIYGDLATRALKTIQYEIQKQKTWNGQESVHHVGLPPIIQKRIERTIANVLGEVK